MPCKFENMVWYVRHWFLFALGREGRKKGRKEGRKEVQPPSWSFGGWVLKML